MIEMGENNENLGVVPRGFHGYSMYSIYGSNRKGQSCICPSRVLISSILPKSPSSTAFFVWRTSVLIAQVLDVPAYLFLQIG